MKTLAVVATGAILLAGFWLALAQKKGVPPEDQPLIASIQGPELYRAYCAVCHGADAKGKGPMATLLKNGPTDLTRLAARRGGKFPREEIRKIIAGEGDRPSHGTSDMPVWGPIFSKVTRDVDLGQVRIDNLARFLEEIQQK